MKICKTCKLEKDLSCFYKNLKAKDKVQSSCSECSIKAQRDWYCRNKDKCREKRYARYKKDQVKNNEMVKNWLKENPTKTREYQVKQYYGLSLEQYELLKTSQNNSCAICGINVATNGKNLAVDHCHSTGKIRGLLCSNCNRAVGLLKDDTTILAKAIEYLNNSRDTQTDSR